MNNADIFKVSEITQRIKQTLELNFFAVRIEGEISNYRPSSSGHVYFTLKDDKASIQAVIFRGKMARLDFVPKDGMQVCVSGSVSVYEPRGTYQIICDSMEKFGVGKILAMLEERKQRLSLLGFFDKKREIPRTPGCVAVVTSPTGAAVRDIINVVSRRNSGLKIRILPAVVQGSEAAESVARQIRFANKQKLADVIIVARGGGSVEDLLPFSEEVVVKAIYESELPVISAIGHEIDFALSDFAADLRAPTPSAAAELVTSEAGSLAEGVARLKRQITADMRTRINSARLVLNSINSKEMVRNYNFLLANRRQSVDICKDRLINSFMGMVANKRHELRFAVSTIEANSPKNILEKGYAIVTDASGKLVQQAEMVAVGAEIQIQLGSGKIKSEVKEIL